MNKNKTSRSELQEDDKAIEAVRLEYNAGVKKKERWQAVRKVAARAGAVVVIAAGTAYAIQHRDTESVGLKGGMPAKVIGEKHQNSHTGVRGQVYRARDYVTTSQHDPTNPNADKDGNVKAEFEIPQEVAANLKEGDSIVYDHDIHSPGVIDGLSYEQEMPAVQSGPAPPVSQNRP